MNPAEAIAELKELSTQIEAVVLAGRDGRSIASNLATEPASRLAADAATLVSGADEVRRDLGREGLTRCRPPRRTAACSSPSTASGWRSPPPAAIPRSASCSTT